MHAIPKPSLRIAQPLDLDRRDGIRGDDGHQNWNELALLEGHDAWVTLGGLDFADWYEVIHLLPIDRIAAGSMARIPGHVGEVPPFVGKLECRTVRRLKPHRFALAGVDRVSVQH